jgi:DNA-binding NarL/FixJ family response regulator
MFSTKVKSKTEPIRILVAEDHALVRAGICALLQRLNSVSVEVVAEAGDGHETLHLIKEKKPDIILLDISMPGLNGLEIADRVTKEFSEVRTIILSMYMNEEYVLRAIQVGVAGYLLKNAGIEELELAIKSVARGETYLSPKVSRQVLENYMGSLTVRKRPDKPGPFNYEKLTARQREILQLIAEGYTTKEIANKLNVSVKTVDTHRSQLMERLNIHDIAGLVRYAIRTHVVTLE